MYKNGLLVTTKFYHMFGLFCVFESFLSITDHCAATGYCRCQYVSDCEDSCGVTPLMDSARSNHVETTRYLVREFQVWRSYHNNNIFYLSFCSAET